MLKLRSDVDPSQGGGLFLFESDFDLHRDLLGSLGDEFFQPSSTGCNCVLVFRLIATSPEKFRPKESGFRSRWNSTRQCTDAVP